MYGINFNKQDEKVEWLPLEYFDDSEYDEHNDDRLSHVSAPMSDYSCTTINSEMNRSIGGNEVSEEEEEDENAEPFQMPEEYDSQHESYSQDF